MILPDEHARRRGISEPAYQQKFKNIENTLRSFGIETVALSSLWRRWRIRDDIIQAWVQRHEERSPGWGAGERQVAKEDRVMRDLESKKLEQQYPDAVLLSLTSKGQQPAPDLPALYLATTNYSLSRRNGTPQRRWQTTN